MLVLAEQQRIDIPAAAQDQTVAFQKQHFQILARKIRKDHRDPSRFGYSPYIIFIQPDILLPDKLIGRIFQYLRSNSYDWFQFNSPFCFLDPLYMESEQKGHILFDRLSDPLIGPVVRNDLHDIDSRVPCRLYTSRGILKDERFIFRRIR